MKLKTFFPSRGWHARAPFMAIALLSLALTLTLFSPVWAQITTEAELDAAISEGVTALEFGEALITLSGQKNLNPDSRLTGQGANSIIDGAINNRLFYIDGSCNGVYGLTLQNGYVNEASSGGALYVASDFSGNIANSIFNNNSVSSLYGGALYVGSTFAGNIIGSTFTNNRAGGVGGVMYVFRDFNGIIIDSVFTNNYASGNGGALWIGGNLNNDIINSTFTDNSSGALGGALYVTNDFNGDITGSLFSNNSTSSLYGGAVRLGGSFRGNIINSTFTDNSGGNNGGALYVAEDFNGSITGSVFSNNRAGSNGNGGAIWVGNTFTADISGSTFSNNTATGNGGAIYATGNLVLSAMQGDAWFNGNNGGSGSNAIYQENGTTTLAAGQGHSIYFYDPIVSNSPDLVSINRFNNEPTSGSVVFDGRDYYDPANPDATVIDRTSIVNGPTIVYGGTMALKNKAVFMSDNSFTLANGATLFSDSTGNTLQANSLSFYATSILAFDLSGATTTNLILNGTLNSQPGIVDIHALNGTGTFNLATANNGNWNLSAISALTLRGEPMANTRAASAYLGGDGTNTLTFTNTMDSGVVQWNSAISSGIWNATAENWIGQNIPGVSDLSNETQFLHGDAVEFVGQQDQSYQIVIQDNGVQLAYKNNTYPGMSFIGDNNATWNFSGGPIEDGSIFIDGTNTIAFDTRELSQYITVNNGVASLMAMENETLTIDNVSDGVTDGGAIYIHIAGVLNLGSEDGELIISDNSAVGADTTANSGRGGAIYAAGDYNGTITNSVFSNNSAIAGNGGAYNGWGGAIYTASSYDGDIINSAFNSNSAVANASGSSGGRGGAIYVAGSYSGDIINSVFSNNSVTGYSGASSGWGGAIYAESDYSGDIINSVFSNNSVISGSGYESGRGGAIYAYASFSSDISGSSFINNFAQLLGGAYYIADDMTLQLTSGNASFRGNTAGNEANAIYLQNTNNNIASMNVADGYSLEFYDPIASDSGSFEISLNEDATGTILLDMSGVNNKTSAVYADTTLYNGSLDMRGGAVYGVNATIGSFTINSGSTLQTDATSNAIQAANITLDSNSTLNFNLAMATDDSAGRGTTNLQLNAGDVVIGNGPVKIVAVNTSGSNKYHLLHAANANFTSAMFDYENTFINSRYGSHTLEVSATDVWLNVTGEDQNRLAIWRNYSGDNLWNETSSNWELENLPDIHEYKNNDKALFDGNPDGAVTVDGNGIYADTMEVSGGDYVFQGGDINANSVTLSGGSTQFDNSLNFRDTFTVQNNATLNLAIKADQSTGSITGGGTSAFIMQPGSLLQVEPGGSVWHSINANTIDLQNGSRVGLMGFSYGPILTENGTYTVLRLNGVNVTNASALVSTSGSIAIGAYRYDYSDLYWDEADGSLKMVISSSPGPDPVLSGKAAIGGPGAMAVQNPLGDAIMPHLSRVFARSEVLEKASSGQLVASLLNPGQMGGLGLDGEPDLMALKGRLVNNGAGMESGFSFSDSQPMWLGNGAGGGDMLMGSSSLWFNPSYSYTSNKGSLGYNVKTPSWAMGFDHWFGKDFFLGMAVRGNLPEYESRDADLDSKNISFALYGGAVLPYELELGLFAGYGQSNYQQTRRAEEQIMTSDYDSKNINLGLSLARYFAFDNGFGLRPFATYEYMRLAIDGYNEGQGQQALNVDSHNQNLHFVRLGMELNHVSDMGVYLGGRVYYAGLYGDTEASVESFFAQDPGRNMFTSVSEGLDKHSLGLGLSVALPLGEDLELGAGYNFLLGEDNHTHQGNISLMIKF